MEEILKPGERLDDLQRKGYQIIQNPEKFCFGIDAVLLSEFAKVKSGENVVDFGTGTGILPILLEAKTKGSQFIGLEIQDESADMARRSVSYNGLEDKIEIVTGDIKDALSIFGASSFHVVTCNPPYMANQQGIINPKDAKAIARHEILCNLEDVISQGSKVLKQRGRMYLIHRPNRIVDIMNLMRKYHIEPKRMRFVHPYIDKKPTMVMIEGLKGGNPELIVEPPLIMYQAPGIYHQEIAKLSEGFE